MEQTRPPALAECSVYYLRNNWREFATAVYGDDEEPVHALVTMSKGHNPDDPNRKAVSVAVPPDWWSEHAGDRKGMRIAEMPVSEARRDLSLVLDRTAGRQREHIVVSRWRVEVLVFMPPSTYARWTNRRVEDLIAASGDVD